MTLLTTIAIRCRSHKEVSQHCDRNRAAVRHAVIWFPSWSSSQLRKTWRLIDCWIRLPSLRVVIRQPIKHRHIISSELSIQKKILRCSAHVCKAQSSSWPSRSRLGYLHRPAHPSPSFPMMRIICSLTAAKMRNSPRLPSRKTLRCHRQNHRELQPMA